MVIEFDVEWTFQCVLQTQCFQKSLVKKYAEYGANYFKGLKVYFMWIYINVV